MKKIITIIFLSVSLESFSQEKVLQVTIDERIETLYAIAYFSDYFLVTNHDNFYKQTLGNKKFDNLKNHRAVELFDKLSLKYHFKYSRPVEWALQYSPFPGFTKENTRADATDLTYPKEKEYLLEELRKEIISFYKNSLFQNYLKATKLMNQKMIESVTKSQRLQKLPAYLEEYYGTKLDSYNLIISPLMHSGGFNTEFISPNNKRKVYALIGPNGEIDFLPYFDKDYLETDLILHEFGHSFVNPFIEEYDSKIEMLKELYYTEELKKSGDEQGYGEWKYVFNELLLRATTIQITKKHFGNEKADKLLEFEKSIGFGLVEKIITILENYEQNREQYKTFEIFYPKLIERMKE